VFKIAPKAVLAAALTLVMSCSENNQATFPDQPIDNFNKDKCAKSDVIKTSESFLSNLLKNDVEGALNFYAPNHQESGDGYGIDYTFFPERVSDAIFDILQKNKESKIFVEDIGRFENGRLIGFFQSHARGQTKNIDYLSLHHGKTFMVCNFICISGEWKIAEYTCFEDSGSPFE